MRWRRRGRALALLVMGMTTGIAAVVLLAMQTPDAPMMRMATVAAKEKEKEKEKEKPRLEIHAFWTEATAPMPWTTSVWEALRGGDGGWWIDVVAHVHAEGRVEEGEACERARGSVERLAGDTAAGTDGPNRTFTIECGVPSMAEDPTARRNAVMAAGRAFSQRWRPDQAYLVLLEDVVDVSAALIPWIDSAVAYLQRRRTSSPLSVVGASLYSPAYNEVADVPFHGPDQAAFLLQVPAAWGSVFPLAEWQRFQAWCDAQASRPAFRHPLDIRDAYTNRWPVDQSWRKWLLRYMAEQGAVMLYPPQGRSFVQPFAAAQVVGHPVNANEPRDRSIFLSPLVGPGDLAWLATTASELAVLDVRHQRRSPAAAATSAALKLDVDAADGCSVILPVYSRLRTLPDRLERLAAVSSVVRAIVVAWNNIATPPSEALLAYVARLPIPVTLALQPVNSLNNRLFPYPQLLTDCVFTLDDDFDVADAVVARLSALWHAHFFDRLVGLTGRNHGWKPSANGTALEYTYFFYHYGQPAMALTGGLMVHRRYLSLYQALPAALRDVVTNLTNCEDLLLNVMVANLTRQGPVVLVAPVNKVGRLGAVGLSGRSEHLRQRSHCLNTFAAALDGGRLPFLCTKALSMANSTASSRPWPYLPPARDEIASFPCRNYLADPERKAARIV